MKPYFLLSCVLLLTANSAKATEYIYRDLMANTLPTVACLKSVEAETLAQKQYNLDKYSKRFCQSQGYGWHIEAVKDNGKLVCNDCAKTEDKKQCHLEDVIVTCKRIKPGSVGMLPGKS